MRSDSPPPGSPEYLAKYRDKVAGKPVSTWAAIKADLDRELYGPMPGASARYSEALAAPTPTPAVVPMRCDPGTEEEAEAVRVCFADWRKRGLVKTYGEAQARYIKLYADGPAVAATMLPGGKVVPKGQEAAGMAVQDRADFEKFCKFMDMYNAQRKEGAL